MHKHTGQLGLVASLSLPHILTGAVVAALVMGFVGGPSVMEAVVFLASFVFATSVSFVQSKAFSRWRQVRAHRKAAEWMAAVERKG